MGSKTNKKANKDFAKEFDKWISEGSIKRGNFNICKTSKALRSIGVKEQDILWDKSKLKKIMKKHKEMSPEQIKDVIKIIEKPVIVMQSLTKKDSLTLLGDVFAKGNPVMATLLLEPTNEKGRILNLAKISSAYVKDNLQGLVDRSDMLYIDPDKKRTDAWLRSVVGLQLPRAVTEYGSLGKVAYSENNSNSKKQNNQKKEKVFAEELFNTYQSILKIDGKERNITMEVLNKEKVNIRVPGAFVKKNLPSKKEEGKTYNKVTMPKNAVIDGKTVGGYAFYPLYVNEDFSGRSYDVPLIKSSDVQLNKNGEKLITTPDKIKTAFEESYKASTIDLSKDRSLETLNEHFEEKEKAEKVSSTTLVMGTASSGEKVVIAEINKIETGEQKEAVPDKGLEEFIAKHKPGMDLAGEVIAKREAGLKEGELNKEFGRIGELGGLLIISDPIKKASCKI
ncbi:MAG: hypothetical protein ACRCUS_08675 [Anaerovoracaceae bacterium]